jgi:hypothetical protein
MSDPAVKESRAMAQRRYPLNFQQLGVIDSPF